MYPFFWRRATSLNRVQRFIFKIQTDTHCDNGAKQQLFNNCSTGCEFIAISLSWMPKANCFRENYSVRRDADTRSASDTLKSACSGPRFRYVSNNIHNRIKCVNIRLALGQQIDSWLLLKIAGVEKAHRVCVSG